MLNSIFQKIDKSKYPKTARRWSLSVIFVYPVFVIANKLWLFLYVYLAVNFINFILMAFGIDQYLVNLISVFTFAILLFFTFYLMLYGRVLAWQRLGYRDAAAGVIKFRLRQRIVMYIMGWWNKFGWWLLIFLAHLQVNIDFFCYFSLVWR